MKINFIMKRRNIYTAPVTETATMSEKITLLASSDHHTDDNMAKRHELLMNETADDTDFLQNRL